MKFFQKTKHKIGLSPGTLHYTGEKTSEPIRISVLDYTKDSFNEEEITDVLSLKKYAVDDSVTWINISGVHDTSLVSEICNQFNVHPLVQEDIVHTSQRPKMEVLDDYAYFVFHLIHTSPEGALDFEQISMILANNYVITFQENPRDIFDPIRERINSTNWRIRSRKTDYLAYAIIDLVVDHYFYVLELIGQRMEELESGILENPTQSLFQEVHSLRRELVRVRRAVWPLRELVSQFQKCELKLIEVSTQVYLRDLYDHTIQVIDTTENFRELSSSLLDLYMTSISNKMNEVMKVLTIIATIFIPLTFIAGIYGMNFAFMPELSWSPGYFVVLGVMFCIAVGMIFYFRKKSWL
jgi:magnesium transporter